MKRSILSILILADVGTAGFSNDQLVWLVPAAFTIIGVAFMCGLWIASIKQTKDSLKAVHRRLSALVKSVRSIQESLIAARIVRPSQIIEPEGDDGTESDGDGDET